MTKPRKPKKNKVDQTAQSKDSDKALWQAFTSNIEPLSGKQRVPENEPAKPKLQHPKADSKQPVPTSQNKPLKHHAPIPAKKTKPQPPPKPRTAQFNQKEMRRIGKGRTNIDARIDLHGLRQNEAYSALRVFLQRSVAKGHRLVLVITGKGKADTNDGSYSPYINEAAEPRGILRRKVPMWLEEPEFRPIIVGYSTAHIHHGGDGALYVQLRRNRQHEPRG